MKAAIIYLCQLSTRIMLGTLYLLTPQDTLLLSNRIWPEPGYTCPKVHDFNRDVYLQSLLQCEETSLFDASFLKSLLGLLES